MTFLNLFAYMMGFCLYSKSCDYETMFGCQGVKCCRKKYTVANGLILHRAIIYSTF